MSTGARVAVITGAASGLGRVVAERFADEGCALCLLDRDETALADTAAALSARGTPLTHATTDIRQREACLDAVNACTTTLGAPDILVNCAGVYPRVGLMDMTLDDWHHDLDINLAGTYFMMVAVTPAMRAKRRGHIINIASIDAFTPHPDNAHYAASKAAVVSLTRSFALALAGDGILVNAVAPGPLATERAKRSDWYAPMVAELPTATPIEPAEIAATVAFLARPDNRSLTGETVIVSAGAVMA